MEADLPGASSATAADHRRGSERQKLRVLLDGRMALRGLGISTFLDRLVEGLSAQPSVTLALWKGSDDWGRQGKLATLGRSGVFDVSPRLDPRTHPFDVVHFLSNIGSIFPGRRSVLTVHDMLYRRRQRSRDRILGFLLEQSLGRAGRVVAVSARTADEIGTAFPALAGRVHIIPHGMRRLAPATVERRHLVAFGGGHDPRKRTDLMVAVYREYRDATKDPLPLFVLARAGLTEPQSHQLRELDAKIIRSATADEVDRLVAGAAAVLYTTTAEGFGLPILEAAEAGTPVVLDASADVAAEVLGQHCLLVENPDVKAWAEAVRRAVAGGPVPDALHLPDWETVAHCYLELYQEVSGC